MANQTIHCGVDSCRHNQMGTACDLSGITVGADRVNCSATPECACETECSSFETR